jgi:hypothetical protein
MGIPDHEQPGPTDTAYGYALPGRRFAQVCMSCLLLAAFGVIAALLPQAKPLAVPLCLAAVPLFAVALVAAVPFAARGADAVSAPALALGLAAILGGTACDIVATVHNSPDLKREANPFLRGLLDNGVSLDRVFLLGAVSQGLFVALAVALWFGVLRHRTALVGTMPPAGSVLEYFKAGTGGRELTYRQWLCPLKHSEFPWAFHVAVWAGVAFVSISVYRFYLALEWYRLVPLQPLGVRFVAPAVVLLATCWWYGAWLRAAHARTSDRPAAEPLPTADELPPGEEQAR